MRILMILVADSPSGSGERQSLLPEFSGIANACNLLREAGAEVVIASPAGGSPPIRADRPPLACDLLLPAGHDIREALNDTLRLDQIYPGDFHGALCIGGLDSAAADGDFVPAFPPVSTLLSTGRPVIFFPAHLGKVFQGEEGASSAGPKADTLDLAVQALLAALGAAGD